VTVRTQGSLEVGHAARPVMSLLRRHVARRAARRAARRCPVGRSSVLDAAYESRTPTGGRR
jgi:hypothetical protein